MKINNETVEVLKNFSLINPSILIKEGKVLETISSTKTIKATATTPTVWPQRFAIYNLAQFIGALSVYESPELTFFDSFLTISEGTRKSKIVYSDEDTIIKVPEKTLKLPSVDVSVTVTDAQLKDIFKGLAILGVPEIVFTGNGEGVSLVATDTKNPTSCLHSVEVGETTKTFKAIFKVENLKLLPGDYTVEICSKGISRWHNDQVEYFIAVEKDSTFA